MTYGAGYEETKEAAEEANSIISNSRTWSAESPQKVPNLQVVTRRAPNLKDLLFKRKKLSLDSGSRTTDPCTEPGRRKEDGLFNAVSLSVVGLQSQIMDTLSIHKVGTARHVTLFTVQRVNFVL